MKLIRKNVVNLKYLDHFEIRNIIGEIPMKIIVIMMINKLAIMIV